jgi:hypothetical protein
VMPMRSASRGRAGLCEGEMVLVSSESAIGH